MSACALYGTVSLLFKAPEYRAPLGLSLELVAVGLYVSRVLCLPLLGYLVRAVQQHLGLGLGM